MRRSIHASGRTTSSSPSSERRRCHDDPFFQNAADLDRGADRRGDGRRGLLVKLDRSGADGANGRSLEPADACSHRAVFPLTGNGASLATQELAGVRIAVDLANADGGISGRPIELDVHDLQRREDAPAVMADLAARGIDVVIGTYASDLSIAASQAADAAGLVYWESGAVADRVTGRGLPRVFRVGASGADLGAGSATFATSQLAPLLGRTAPDLRLAIVAADDEYARSVADAAAATADAAGVFVERIDYSLSVPDWPGVMSRLAAAKADVVVLASHIPDGIAFRKAMVAAGIKVGALIGSTMAQCDPDFAGDLGADAVGVFASDRPTAGFHPEALDPQARAAYDRFAAAWHAPAVETGGDACGHGSGEEGGDADGPSLAGSTAYSIMGPAEAPSAEAAEEALAGFSAAWALVRDVLHRWQGSAAASTPRVSPGRAGARSADRQPAQRRWPPLLVEPATLGQNERAAAVIWQWQAVRTYAFVWPPRTPRGRSWTCRCHEPDRHRARGVGGSSSARPDHGGWPVRSLPAGEPPSPRPRTACSLAPPSGSCCCSSR